MKPFASLVSLALVALAPTLALAGDAAPKAHPKKVTAKVEPKADAKHAAKKELTKGHVAPKKPGAKGLDKVALKRVVEHAVDSTLSHRQAATHSEPTEIELAKLAEDGKLEALPKPKSLEKVSAKKEIKDRGHSPAKELSKEHPKAKKHGAKDVGEDGKLTKVATKVEVLEKTKRAERDADGAEGPSVEGRCGLDLVLRHDGKEEVVPVKTCDGKLVPGALDKVAVLVGDGGKTAGLDPRLLARVGEMAAHFGRKGKLPEIEILGGGKNGNSSMHKEGRALDVRFVGVKNEDVASFCRTLDDTGCGYYPNGKFVHVDVRDAGTGKVSWIDMAAPGETPRYVAAVPAKESDKTVKAAKKEPAKADKHEPREKKGKTDA